MATETSITGRYRDVIRDWGRAIANCEVDPTENPQFYNGYEKGMRDALFAVSLDLGWDEAEWNAIEMAAQQRAQKMIAEDAD